MTLNGRSWILGVMVGLGTIAAWGQVAAKDDPADLAGEQVRVAGGYAPIPINEGAAALRQLLPKLRTRGSLMLIVAHPDDEDGGMLTAYSRGMGARVAMLTLNRGEGGQNLMSADFDDALGLIRTQELLAADRYMGVDQMFGTVVDFGFSKTLEEAMTKWGHDRVLYDAVRAVRLYRPLVVASVFVGGVTDGHGQHQVSGEMAQEVYVAAGDPKVFPEMGLATWSPLKVYARVPFARVTKEGMFDYATGKYAPTRFYNYITKTWSTDLPVANVTVHEGDQNPALGGMSYIQFARQGLALQKSQIGAGTRVAPPGVADSGYTRYGSRVTGLGAEEKSFFDGIDVSLAGIADLAPSDKGGLRTALVGIDASAGKAAAAFSMEAPEASAAGLLAGLRSLDGLIAQVEHGALPVAEKENVLHELRVKRVQFNDALALALGLKLTAAAEDATGTLLPGQMATAAVKVTETSGKQVETLDSSLASTLGSGKSGPGTRTDRAAVSVGAEHVDTVSLKLAEAAESRPYFSRPDAEQPFYNLSDAALRNAPMSPSALIASADLRYEGVEIELRTAVATSVASVAAVPVDPAVSVALSPAAGIVPLTEKSFRVTARVKSNAAGTLRLQLPAGWRSSPAKAEFGAAEAEVPFVVSPEALSAGKPYTLTAVAEVGGKAYREGYKSVGYGDLVRTNYFRPAVYRTSGVEVKIAQGLRVGYLAGTGDAVPASLGDIGIKVTMLSAADVLAGKLDGFDTVVLGVRAYAAHPELRDAGSAGLLAFAKAGGTVIVQYNTGAYGQIGPYPLSGAGDERVIDETDRVTLLTPEDPLLRWPNRITAKDFDGWVEERGHGFMGTWDPRYQALLEMHDPEQDPQKGGLLVARIGKGTWVYCSLALYRQLPEGVPGAYRVFANLLSAGKEPVAAAQNAP